MQLIWSPDDVISKYNSILGSKDITIEEEIKDNTLERILSLYFHVRAFSYAKDVVQEHKRSKQAKKAKSLHKDIKRAGEINTTEFECICTPENVQKHQFDCL